MDNAGTQNQLIYYNNGLNTSSSNSNLESVIDSLTPNSGSLKCNLNFNINSHTQVPHRTNGKSLLYDSLKPTILNGNIFNHGSSTSSSSSNHENWNHNAYSTPPSFKQFEFSRNEYLALPGNNPMNIELNSLAYQTSFSPHPNPDMNADFAVSKELDQVLCDKRKYDQMVALSNTNGSSNNSCHPTINSNEIYLERNKCHYNNHQYLSEDNIDLNRYTSTELIPYSSCLNDNYNNFCLPINHSIANIEDRSIKANLEQNRKALMKKLLTRRPVTALIEQGILPPLTTPISIYHRKHKLERAKKGDYLKHKIARRPDRTQLVRQHILQDVRVDPHVAETQRALKRAKIMGNLNDRLSRRPGPIDLVKANYLVIPNLKGDCFHANQSNDITNEYISESDERQQQQQEEQQIEIFDLTEDIDNGAQYPQVSTPTKFYYISNASLFKAPKPPPLPSKHYEQYQQQLQRGQYNKRSSSFNYSKHSLKKDVIHNFLSSEPGLSCINLDIGDYFLPPISSSISQTPACSSNYSVNRVKTMKFHEYRGPGCSFSNSNSNSVGPIPASYLNQQDVSGGTLCSSCTPSGCKTTDPTYHDSYVHVNSHIISTSIPVLPPCTNQYELLLRQQKLFLQLQIECQQKLGVINENLMRRQQQDHTQPDPEPCIAPASVGRPKKSSPSTPSTLVLVKKQNSAPKFTPPFVDRQASTTNTLSIRSVPPLNNHSLTTTTTDRDSYDRIDEKMLKNEANGTGSTYHLGGPSQDVLHNRVHSLPIRVGSGAYENQDGEQTFNPPTNSNNYLDSQIFDQTIETSSEYIVSQDNVSESIINIVSPNTNKHVSSDGNNNNNNSNMTQEMEQHISISANLKAPNSLSQIKPPNKTSANQTASTKTINHAKNQIIKSLLELLTVPELRGELRKRKMTVSGPKPHLLERLKVFETEIVESRQYPKLLQHYDQTKQVESTQNNTPIDVNSVITSSNIITCQSNVYSFIATDVSAITDSASRISFDNRRLPSTSNSKPAVPPSVTISFSNRTLLQQPDDVATAMAISIDNIKKDLLRGISLFESNQKQYNITAQTSCHSPPKYSFSSHQNVHQTLSHVNAIVQQQPPTIALPNNLDLGNSNLPLAIKIKLQREKIAELERQLLRSRLELDRQIALAALEQNLNRIVVLPSSLAVTTGSSTPSMLPTMMTQRTNMLNPSTFNLKLLPNNLLNYTLLSRLPSSNLMYANNGLINSNDMMSGYNLQYRNQQESQLPHSLLINSPPNNLLNTIPSNNSKYCQNFLHPFQASQLSPYNHSPFLRPQQPQTFTILNDVLPPKAIKSSLPTTVNIEKTYAGTCNDDTDSPNIALSYYQNLMHHQQSLGSANKSVTVGCSFNSPQSLQNNVKINISNNFMTNYLTKSPVFTEYAFLQNSNNNNSNLLNNCNSDNLDFLFLQHNHYSSANTRAPNYHSNHPSSPNAASLTTSNVNQHENQLQNSNGPQIIKNGLAQRNGGIYLPTTCNKDSIHHPSIQYPATAQFNPSSLQVIKNSEISDIFPPIDDFEIMSQDMSPLDINSMFHPDNNSHNFD